MTRTTIAGGVFAVVVVFLVLATGRRDRDQDDDPVVATAPATLPSNAAEEGAYPGLPLRPDNHR